MASGSMRLKDPGIPLSVGFNLQFDISNKAGNTSFVVHIDSVSTTFQMMPDGQKITTTEISFSRMMQTQSAGSVDLKFCPAGTWGDMWHNNKLNDVRKKEGKRL
jgi:hypothetical protein